MHHSKTTLKGVRLIEETLKNREGLFLVALSGGADSLALLQSAVIASSKKKNSFKIQAVIIDHQLQEGSDEIARRAKEISEKLGVKAIIKTVKVPNNGEGTEAAARDARYSEIYKTIEETGAEGVLLGHTMNDQAEQVFLGLLRGSGTRSLSGIPQERDLIIRPFLTLSRDDTQRICDDNGLEYWTDPHNSCLDYSRVKVRKNIIPVLQENFGIGIINNLSKTAELSRDAADALDYMLDKEFDYLFDTDSKSYSVTELEVRPVSLQKMLIRKALVETFDSYGSFNDVKNVYKLIEEWNGQDFIAVSKGRVYRKNDRLLFCQE